MERSSLSADELTRLGLSDVEGAALATWIATPSDDQLIATLGESLDADYAFGFDPLAKGRAWLRNARQMLRARICPDHDARLRDARLSESHSDTLALAAVFASLLQGQLGGAINVTLVAVILARQGVRSLCA